MADKDPEKVAEVRDVVITPGKEFSYISSHPKTLGMEKQATLAGYARADGKLVALYSVHGDTKPGYSNQYVDELCKSVKSIVEGEKVYFGGKVRRSNGEIEDGWVYMEQGSDFLLFAKHKEETDRMFTRKVKLDEFVQLNSPVEPD